MTTIPYLPAEWLPGMKKLPAHTLCLSHVKVDGKRLCLAVPEREAPARIRAIARLRAHIDRQLARRAKLEAKRPRPEHASARSPLTDRFWKTPSKRHRHSVACLEESDRLPAGWFWCKTLTLHHARGQYLLHEHRTKRGRRYLVNHGERCPQELEAAA